MLGRPGKIRVEIIGGAVPIRRNCPIEGTQVIVEQESKLRGGAAYLANYDNDCLVPYVTGPPLFRSVKFKLLLRYGASKCISFGKNAGDIAPSCTPGDIDRLGTATVIKLAGSLKGENRTLIYALILVNIILTVIAVAVASGGIKI